MCLYSFCSQVTSGSQQSVVENKKKKDIHVCIYIYVCMCVCMYMYVHVSIYVYVCTCMHTFLVDLIRSLHCMRLHTEKEKNFVDKQS